MVDTMVNSTLNIAKHDPTLVRTLGNLNGGQAPASPAPGDKPLVDEAKEAAKSKVLAAVDNKPGEMACHMIYKSSLQNTKVSKMLEGQVRFNPRKAIERAESMGADRLASSAS